MRMFGNWKVTRLRIQCTAVHDHAKILLLDGRGREYAETLGKLICGESQLYICKPQDGSPIGRCAVCGAKLTYELQHVEPEQDQDAEFEFAGLRVRRSGREDLELAQVWTEADPAHATDSPTFWILQSELVQSYLVGDADGPLYFFTGQLNPDVALDLHVQFAPAGLYRTLENQHALRGRTMRALIESTRWLEERMAGVVPVIRFATRNPQLARFCVKRMGFVSIHASPHGEATGDSVRDGYLVRTLKPRNIQNLQNVQKEGS
jgi:hypothetical protein